MSFTDSSVDLSLFQAAWLVHLFFQEVLSLPLIYAWGREEPSGADRFQGLPEVFGLFTSCVQSSTQDGVFHLPLVQVVLSLPTAVTL